jgi:hypothetical protein
MLVAVWSVGGSAVMDIMSKSVRVVVNKWFALFFREGSSVRRGLLGWSDGVMGSTVFWLFSRPGHQLTATVATISQGPTVIRHCFASWRLVFIGTSHPRLSRMAVNLSVLSLSRVGLGPYW